MSTILKDLLAKMPPDKAKAVKAALKREREHRADKHDPILQHERRLEWEANWRRIRQNRGTI